MNIVQLAIKYCFFYDFMVLLWTNSCEVCMKINCFSDFNIYKNNKFSLNKKKVLALGILSTSLLTGCNRTMFDTKYGFNQALILGDDSAVVLDVSQWKDYSGEQLQLITDNNFVLLTSSFDTNCFYGDSNQYSVDDIGLSAISDSNNIYYLTDTENDSKFNKDLFDTQFYFNKAVTFNGNRAIVLPIKQWKDYEGEQLQIITTDGLVLNVSSWNSKLAYDVDSPLKLEQFAQSYVGNDGVVTSYADDTASDDFHNKDLFDTVYNFNKALIMKDEKVVIVPIDEWKDYEGEQLQLKIHDGPTIVTASYDTILVNDNDSTMKALDVAKSLCEEENIVDLASGKDNVEGSFNKTFFDFDYGFSNGIISGKDAASTVSVDTWGDYEGEQLQIELDSGDIILTSSILLDLVNGGNNNINASTLAKDYVSSEGRLTDLSGGDYSEESFNKDLLDTELKFKYALKVIDGNVTIIPLKKWEDFYNTDGGKDKEDSPNCEQIQLVLPDETALVTTAYDTVLVNNTNTDINEIAGLFVGKDGVITNLEEYVGVPEVSGWNFSLFDTRYSFSYAILNNEDTSQVFPIVQWLDFSEGEALQLNFQDDTGMLTSFVTTTLVDPATEGMEEILANAFTGNSEDNEKVKVYK